MALGIPITDLVRAHIIRLKGEGLSQRHIADRVGHSQSTVNAALKDAAKKGELGFAPVLPGFEVTSTTERTDAKGRTVARTVKQHKEHGEVFTVPKGLEVKGVSAFVDAEDRVIGKWVLTRPEAKVATTKDDLLQAFAEYRGKSDYVPLPKADLSTEHETLYKTSDLHIGMQAWGRETGVPWDLKIAREVVYGSMQELVHASFMSSTAVLLDLGDYTHNNNQDNVTPGHKHQLDVDGRFRKVAREAIKLRLDFINLLLRKHAKVIVRSLPGNHDPDVAQLLSAAFGVFFENNERVEVDDDPSEFWVHEFGVNMLLANHGHKTKPSKLPGVMAGRFPEMWGRTKVRRAFSGHIHHETSGEDMGASWETCRTVSPGDSFGHSHGFVAMRELKSDVYHRTRGWRGSQVVQIL